MATTKEKKVAALRKVVKSAVANKMDESAAHEAAKGDTKMDMMEKPCKNCGKSKAKCNC